MNFLSQRTTHPRFITASAAALALCLASLAYGQGKGSANGESSTSEGTSIINDGVQRPVSLTAGAQGRLIASNLSFGTGGQFAAENVRAGTAPIYFASPEASGTRENFTAKGATFYYGPPERWGVSIQTNSAQFTAPGTLTLKGARLRLAGVPVLPLGTLKHSGTQPPITARTRAGYNSRFGAYLRTEAYLPSRTLAAGKLINKGATWRPGFLLDGYTNRGVLIGPALQYNNVYGASGTLRGGWIADQGSPEERKEDVLGKPIGQDRSFVQWRHQQLLENLEHPVSITASLDVWSDSEVLRDFRPDWFTNNEQPDNFLEITQNRPNSYLSLFTRVHVNDFFTATQRVPELRYDVAPTAITSLLGEGAEDFPGVPAFKNVYLEGFASIAKLIQRDPRGVNDKLVSDRLDAYLGILRPIKLTHWLTATPVAGVRATHYNRTAIADTRSAYTRVLGQIGVDIRANAYAQWDVQNQAWHVNGLRHRISPLIQYRWIPEAETGAAAIPQIDDLPFNTLKPTLDLSRAREVDALQEIHALRFGLENVLETRASESSATGSVPVLGSRELFTFDVYQDYYFKGAEEAFGDDFSDVYTEFAARPNQNIRVQWDNRWDVEALTSRESRFTLGLQDADYWALDLSLHHLDSEIEQYSAHYRLKLAENFHFIPNWRYDARRGELTEQTYAFATRLGQSWDVVYGISLTRGDSRQSNTSFRIKFRLRKF